MRTSRQVADRHVNKWLQLRWGAWQRGRAVADDVRPELIREIDVANRTPGRPPVCRALRNPRFDRRMAPAPHTLVHALIPASRV